MGFLFWKYMSCIRLWCIGSCISHVLDFLSAMFDEGHVTSHLLYNLQCNMCNSHHCSYTPSTVHSIDKKNKKNKNSGFLVWACQANIKFCVGRVYMYIHFSGHLMRIELVLLNYLECLIWFKMTYQSLLYLQQYLSTLEKVNLLTICIYIHNM